MGFSIWNFFQGLYSFTLMNPTAGAVRIFLILLGAFLMYLGYRKTLEPLIMIPMGLGMMAVNGGVLMFGLPTSAPSSLTL